MSYDKKITSFHHYSSLNKGGIEYLIKHLQKAAFLMGAKYYEIFHDSPLATKNTNNVKYVKLSSKRIRSKLEIIKENVRLFRYFNNYKVEGKNEIFFNFSPKYLLFIPNSYLSKIKLVVVQAHNFDSVFTKLGYYGVKKHLKYIDAYTVYTKNDEVKLLSFFPELTGRIHIIPRGCRIKSSEHAVKRSFKLVTIARVHEAQKNFQGMIDVMKKLPNYHLDIYGVGTEKEINGLHKRIEGLDNVSFKGEAEDVATVLKKYSVFLMTSRYEGFGQTLIEARSQGLPIIAFDTFEALDWIVDDGQNGAIVKAFDTNSFVDAIKEVTNNDERFMAYSLCALNKSKQTKYENITKKWIELLNGI